MSNISSTRKISAAERMLEKASEVQGGSITKAQFKLAQRRNGRSLRVTIAVVALIAIVSLLVGTWVAFQVSEQQTRDSLRDASIKILEQANTERLNQGLPPIPIPAPGPEVDLNALASAAASIVIREIRNDPNLRGPNGKTGDACDPTLNALCIGPEGPEGKQGKPGLDSPCVANIELCRGPTGETGAIGDKGVDGPTPIAAVFTEGQELLTCVYRVTYQRADGTQFNLDAPTDPDNCP